MKRRLAAALLAAALALPGLASAVDATPADPAALEAEKELWQSRFEAARAAVTEARERHRAATEAYAKMRHHGKQRGDAKREIIEEVGASEAALEEAEAALKETFEAARSADVPPGWMRMSRGENPAAPETSPEDEEAEVAP